MWQGWSNVDDFTPFPCCDPCLLSPSDKQKIIRDDGRMLNFWLGARDSRDNLTDFHVIDILANDVKAYEVTNINLNACRDITDDTLEFVALSRTAHICGSLVTNSVRTSRTPPASP